MLPNTAATAIDILDYIPLDRGLPKWAFFDLDKLKLDVPDDTVTISIFFDPRDSGEA